MTFRVGGQGFTVSGTVGALPVAYSTLVEHASLHDDLGVGDGKGTALVVEVARDSASWPDLVVALRFEPGPEAGFHPAVHLILETDLLLIGAGLRLLAYDLRHVRRLWEDAADTGFWAWKRHANVIVMSAELELAAWDLQGSKLWSTFVEPPWGYTVEGEQLHLDVMGRKRSFSLVGGPPRAART